MSKYSRFGAAVKGLVGGALAAAALFVAGGIPAADAQQPQLGLFTCDGRQATIVAFLAMDKPVRGTDGPDVIVILGGDGFVSAYGGDDVICGSMGREWITGGDGNDRIFGGGGDDHLYGEHGNDYLRGGPGNDELQGHDGDDMLYGDAGDDRMSGGHGLDALFGGEGNDLLYGTGLGQTPDDRPDLLNGGSSHDKCRREQSPYLLINCEVIFDDIEP